MNVLWPLLSIICYSTIVSSTEQLIGGDDICRLHKDGTVLLKPSYCDRGIECQDSISVDFPKSPCSSTKPHFQPNAANPSGSTCVAKAQFSVCSPQKDPCTRKSPLFINDPYNCDGWFVCENGTSIGSGKCPEHTYFDLEEQMCSYSSKVDCTATYEFCDVTPLGLPFRDEKNCSRYLTCAKNILGTYVEIHDCPYGTFYDITTNSCTGSAMAVCDTLPIPYEICGNAKLAVRGRFVSDRATCRGYYYCRDLGSGKPDTSPQWAQCPETTFFSDEFQACADRTKIKCRFDRCDGRGSGLALSETYGCQHYYQCKDDVFTGPPLRCDNNFFFDEYKQECTAARQLYNVCS